MEGLIDSAIREMIESVKGIENHNYVFDKKTKKIGYQEYD